MHVELRVHTPAGELGRAAADLILAHAKESVRLRGVFTLVLSGGSTPIPLYRRLATPSMTREFPWESSHVFWGDERIASPESSFSNYASAFDTLLSKVPIPSENIHPVPVGLSAPEEAAKTYERELRAFFGCLDEGEQGVHSRDEAPTFDMTLLGVGSDGHTASLFPESPLLKERARWVLHEPHPLLPPLLPRITLTLPAINRARCVLILASGARKARVIHSIWDRPEKAARMFPVAGVRPRGTLVWLLDTEEE